ncbi:hypothetical protein P691DRAFT_648341, partial [Macrolepiota fuliginosa MF-IS2]
RGRKKEAQVHLGELWQQMKNEHQEKLLRWEAETEKLASEGVPRKDWPQRPVRGRKPKLSDLICAEEQGADDDDDDD